MKRKLLIPDKKVFECLNKMSFIELNEKKKLYFYFIDMSSGFINY